MDVWTVVAIGLGVCGVILALGGDAASHRRRTAVRLASIEKKLQVIMEHLDIAEPEPHLPEVIANLEEGQKIQAIKAYRDATGSGLAEAKQAVEQIARARGLDAG